MKQSRLVTTVHFWFVMTLVQLQIFWTAFLLFRNPWKALLHGKEILFNDLDNRSGTKRKKAIVQGNRYFGSHVMPSWPSPAFNRYIRNHLQKASSTSGVWLDHLIIAITNKCGFKCEHCLVWDDLNKKDNLSTDEVITIIHRFRQLGTSLVTFSGGEPLNRWKDMIDILKKAPKDIQYWVYSNGALLTLEKAKQLREAGLVGIIFSLDHHLPEMHDGFRGVNGSFGKVMAAIKYAQEAGLMVCLSLCATGKMANLRSLHAYASLASQKGVHLIQLLEPKPVGHYAGMQVQLTEEDQKTLETFYHYMERLPPSSGKPIVIYPDYYKRNRGCSGNGKDFLYVNADGFIQSCPFCTKQYDHALAPDLAANIEKLTRNRCGLNTVWATTHLQ
jgi:MoaA/NifB/PqqE/SkfB family radical SAM enzyme